MARASLEVRPRSDAAPRPTLVSGTMAILLVCSCSGATPQDDSGHTDAGDDSAITSDGIADSQADMFVDISTADDGSRTDSYVKLDGPPGADSHAMSDWASGTDGTSSFVPSRAISFNGMAAGAPITGKVDWWGTKGTNDFGSFATMSVHRPGKTSAAEFRIQAGTTGRPGDGSPVANGDFGFGLTIPTANQPGEGDNIWVGMWIRFPEGFDFTAGPGFLKFIRITVTGSGGKIDYLIKHDSGGAQTGYNLMCEFDPHSHSYTVFSTPTGLFQLGSWHWFEAYVHLSASPQNAVRRIWLDDKLLVERKGNINKWLGTNGMVTQSIPSGDRTLPTSTDTAKGFMIFTYWNSGPQKNQSVYMQDFVYSTVPPPNLDTAGNKMMGTAFAKTL